MATALCQFSTTAILHYASMSVVTSTLLVNNPAETPLQDRFRIPTIPPTVAGPRASPLLRIANSSARRRREKVVLQSPARRGHSVCIRQIFSDQQQQRNVVLKAYDTSYEDLSYPHPPDVSNISGQLQPISEPHTSLTGTLESNRPSLYSQTLLLYDSAQTYHEPVSIAETMDREQMSDNWSEDEHAKPKEDVQEGFCDPDPNVVGAESLSHAAAEIVCTSDIHQSTGGQGTRSVSTGRAPDSITETLADP